MSLLLTSIKAILSPFTALGFFAGVTSKNIFYDKSGYNNALRSRFSGYRLHSHWNFDLSTGERIDPAAGCYNEHDLPTLWKEVESYQHSFSK